MPIIVTQRTVLQPASVVALEGRAGLVDIRKPQSAIAHAALKWGSTRSSVCCSGQRNRLQTAQRSVVESEDR